MKGAVKKAAVKNETEVPSLTGVAMAEGTRQATWGLYRLSRVQERKIRQRFNLDRQDDGPVVGRFELRLE
jgi:hypothetical protein